MGRYSTRHGLVLAFHGCDLAVRDCIVGGKARIAYSRNRYDWLGYGVYFWENNLTRAVEFANNPPGKRQYSHPSTLGAVIDLGFCLDMLDAEHIPMVTASYNNTKAAFKAADKPVPKNKTTGKSQDF